MSRFVHTKRIGIVMAAMAGILFCASAVFASGNATINLTPTKQTVSVGERFEVELNIVPNQEQIDTARVYLSFDPSIVLVEEVQIGSQLERVSPGNYSDNQEGLVSFGAFTLGGAMDQTGDFVTISFKAMQEGETDLLIERTSHLLSEGEEKINIASVGFAAIVVEEAEEGEIVVELGTLTITESTHPSEVVWYQQNDVALSWEVLPATGVVQYRYAFDQDPQTIPTTTLEQPSLSMDQVEDGVWYVHLLGEGEFGEVTQTVHQKIRIDHTAPNLIQPTVNKEQLIEGEEVELLFGTTDDLSGIDIYEVAIDGGVYVEQTSPLNLSSLAVGTHVLQVGAIDEAGNASYGSVSLRVYEEGTEFGQVVSSTQDKTTNPLGQSILILIAGVGGLMLLAALLALRSKKRRHKKTV